MMSAERTRPRRAEWSQLHLPVPVVDTRHYVVTERLRAERVTHGFRSLTEAVTFVALHTETEPEDWRMLREALLSGREWIHRDRGWRLSAETRR